jgi:hypothetical protein
MKVNTQRRWWSAKNYKRRHHFYLTNIVDIVNIKMTPKVDIDTKRSDKTEIKKILFKNQPPPTEVAWTPSRDDPHTHNFSFFRH